MAKQSRWRARERPLLAPMQLSLLLRNKLNSEEDWRAVWT